MLNSSMWFDPEHISYSGGAIIYVVLIFMFTYFYTEMIINPLEIANNFKKTGGKRLFKMAPIHHHFELSGWPETKVVAIFAITTAVCCLIGLVAI